MKGKKENEIAIKVNSFAKKYPGRDNYAVDNVSFTVYPGEFHGFIGANGAGKTTTIKSLIGAYSSKRYEGEITIFGNKNTTKSAKKHIGYIPENTNFPKNLTTFQYIMHMSILAGKSYKEARKFTFNVLNDIGLGNLRNKNPNSFSSGQKKKVLLAQALVNDPDVIIMDEPAANLDPKARKDFFDNLKTLQAKGKAIFISSHILAELDPYINAVTILDFGKVVYTGKRDELLKSEPFSFNINFLSLEQDQLFWKWMEAHNLKFIDSPLVPKAKTCFLENQANLELALKFILDKKLSIKNFSLDKKTLQQAYDHFVQFGSRDTANTNNINPGFSGASQTSDSVVSSIVAGGA